MNVIRTVQLNLFWGLLSKCLGSLSLIFVTPKLLSAVGTDLFGVYVGLFSLTSWLTLLDLGFGVGVQNKLSYAIQKDKLGLRDELWAYLCRWNTWMGFGILAFIAASAFTALPNLAIGPDADNAIYRDVRTVYILLGVTFFINWLMMPLRTFFIVNGKAHLAHIGNVVAQLGFLIAIIVAPISSISLIFLGGVQLCSAFAGLFVAKIIWKRNHWGESGGAADIDEKLEKRDLYKTSLGFFAIQCIGIAIYQADLLLITNLAGPSEAAHYFIIQKWVMLGFLAWAMVLQPTWPKISSLWAAGNTVAIKKIALRLSLLGSVIALASIVFWVSLGPIILGFWANETVQFHRIDLMLAAAVTALRIWVDTWATFNNAINLLRYQMYSGLSQLVAFVIGGFFLIPNLGYRGAFISQLLGLICVPSWLLVVIFYKSLNSTKQC